MASSKDKTFKKENIKLKKKGERDRKRAGGSVEWIEVAETVFLYYGGHSVIGSRQLHSNRFNFLSAFRLIWFQEPNNMAAHATYLIISFHMHYFSAC